MNAFANDHMLDLIRRLSLRLPLQDQVKLVMHITENIGNRLERDKQHPPYSEYILRLRRFLSESQTASPSEQTPIRKKTASSY